MKLWKLGATALFLGLAGCAGGQARMAGTSAANAEDASRLKAMISDCLVVKSRGDVPPLTSVSREDAAEAAAFYLRQYHAVYGAVPYGYTDEARAEMSRRVGTNVDRAAACLRATYQIPVETPLLAKTSRGAVLSAPAADLVGNMGTYWLGR